MAPSSGQRKSPPEDLARAAEVSPVPAPSIQQISSDVARAASKSIADEAERKQSKKRQERPSNTAKVESIYNTLDSQENIVQLLGQVNTYLKALSEDTSDTQKMKSALALAAKCIGYVESVSLNNINTVKKAANNTAAKKQAEWSHKKVSKLEKLEMSDKLLQMNALAKKNPRKALEMALKQAKEKEQALQSKIKAPSEKPSGEVAEPRKRTKTQADTKVDKAAEYSLPRPQNRRLVYTPQEAATIGYNIDQDKTLNRTEKSRVKDRMINEGKVPVKRTQLNKLISEHGAPGKPAAKPYWNMKGGTEIMTVDDLLEIYNEHAARKGKGWSKEDTKAALVAAMKKSLTDAGKDASGVKAPVAETVDAYHSALMQAAGVTERSCGAKSGRRDAGETSERNMLSNAACILGVRAMVETENDTIPLNLRFDEKSATPGAIKSRVIVAKALEVPVESVHWSPSALLTNQDDMAIYTNWLGDGSCSGKTGQKETMLVDKTAANDPSYGVHSGRDDSKELDGIKVRLTNMMGGRGNLATAFVQVLGFTEAEMPKDLVPNGIIVLKVKGLSPDGGINPLSETEGLLLLIRKGANVEAEMFRLHTELVAEPFVDGLKKNLAGTADPTQLSSFYRAVLSSDGGVPQLKALQGPDALDNKLRRNEAQLKFASNTSGTTQPCDAGKGHMLTRHHSKMLTAADVPCNGLIEPVAAALQQLRDEGKLIIAAAKVEHILNCVIRIPTVLYKSYTPKIIAESFIIPGIMDKSRGGPDLDSLFNTYKKDYTIEQRTKWEADLVLLVKSVLRNGCIAESQFDEFGYPKDTDSNGTEYSPSPNFVTQLSQQRGVILTNPQLMGEFRRVLDNAGSERERQRLAIVEEARWRTKELAENAKYEAKLHRLADRPADSAVALLQGDDPTSKKFVDFIAKQRGSCKSFVRCRSMRSRDDPSFKEPTHVGKADDLQSALTKIRNGTPIGQLDKKENSWIFQAIQRYKDPVVLLDAAAPSSNDAAESSGSVEEDSTPSTAVSRSVVVDTWSCLELDKHFFLDKADIKGQLSRCLKGCHVSPSMNDGMVRQVDALGNTIPHRLRRTTDSLPHHVRYSWAVAAFRDNIHSIAQVLVLSGQVANNIEAASIDESLFKTTEKGSYSSPIASSEHLSCQGVALYQDCEKGKFRHSKVVHGKDKSFEQRYKEDLKNSKKHPPPSDFSRLYPNERPANSEKGGFDGLFEKDIVMFVGIGIDPNGENECLTKRDGGVFVWSDRTMKKLAEANVSGSTEERQLKFVCCMLQLMYSLMMGASDAIDDGLPMRQFLGPVNM